MLGALLISLLAQAESPPWSTDLSQGEDLVVSLVTIGPGDELISWAGHAALVVEDRRLRHERLYNYGMFTAGDGYFLRYLRGQIDIFVGDTTDVVGTYAAYRRQNRDVKIQELNLDPAQRLALARALAINVLPENRHYPYSHFWDNCSTRPRDMIDRAFGGQLHEANRGAAPLTIRALARNYAQVNPAVSLVLDYLQNDELDRPITFWEYAFLPYELEKQLAALQVKGPEGTQSPAVKLQWNFFLAKNRPLPPEGPLSWTPVLLGIGLFVAALGVALDRLRAGAFKAFNVGFGLLYGVLALTLVYASLFTDQSVTYRNENLFLIHPLALGLLGPRAWWRWIWTALAVTGLLGLVLKSLPMFDQQNWNLIALVLPLSVALAISTGLPRKSAS